MPKAKPIASLSGMAETDMDDDTMNTEVGAFPTPDSNQENGPAKKRAGRGKATAKRFTKPRTRRSGDDIPPKNVPSKTKASAKQRAPLKERKNARRADDTEEVDELETQANEDTAMDELVKPKQPAKRKAPGNKVGRPPKKPVTQHVNAIEKDGEFEYTPTVARQSKDLNKITTKQQEISTAENRQPSVVPQHLEKVIPETQVLNNNISSGFPEEDYEDEDAVPQSEFRTTNNSGSTAPSRQPPFERRRAGSASESDRAGNDPATRRKLGDITRKFDNLELKYRTLKETVAKEAQVNLKRFEAGSQAKAKGKRTLHCILGSLTKTIQLRKS